MSSNTNTVNFNFALGTAGSLVAPGTSNTLGSLFTTDGNIGIGTTSPLANFHVVLNNTSGIIAQGVTNPSFVLKTDGTSGNASISLKGSAEKTLQFHNSYTGISGTNNAYNFLNGSSSSIYSMMNNGEALLGGGGDGVLKFYTSRWGYRFEKSGLHFRLVGSMDSVTPRAFQIGRYADDWTGGAWTTSCNIWSYTGNIANLNNSYGGLSDLDLKENIVPARRYLDDIMRVNVVKYSLKAENLQVPNQIGVIAQELEEIFPSLVELSPQETEDGQTSQYKTVKYSVFTPMLITCVQELKQNFDEEIEAHAATNAELSATKAELETTKQELASIKSFLQTKFPGEI